MAQGDCGAQVFSQCQAALGAAVLKSRQVDETSVLPSQSFIERLTVACLRVCDWPTSSRSHLMINPDLIRLATLGRLLVPAGCQQGVQRSYFNCDNGYN